MAFFDSLVKQDGTLGDFSDENGNDTPEYGPLPDDVGYDFLAHATAGHFVLINRIVRSVNGRQEVPDSGHTLAYLFRS